MYNSLKPYDSETKKYIIKLVITNLISAVLILYFSFSTQFLIDYLIDKNNINYIILWIICSILMAIAVNGFNFFFVEYYGDKVSTIISNNIRKKLMKKIINIPYYTYNRLDQGMLFNAIINETNIAAVSFINNKVLFITKIIQIILYILILFFINYQIAVITLFAIPFFIYLSFKNQQDFNDSIKIERKNIDEVVKTFNIIVKNVKQIILCNKNSYFSKEFSNSLDKWGLSRIKYNFYYTFLKTLPNLLNEITILLIYGIGAFFIIKNKLTFGTLILIAQIAILLFQQLTAVVTIKVDVKNAKPIFERIDKILFVKIEGNENLNNYLKNYSIINLNNVDITIDNDNKNLLFHIAHFNLQEPGICLLSAENGAGKTYFLDSLLGLVKGLNPKGKTEIPPFEDIGYLSHPLFFIENSVLENIFIDEEFEPVFIDKMKNILDLDNEFLNKKITLSPLNLSLGQQQKIGLFRFFWIHKDKNLWFLDEPTTNLDIESIYHLRDYLKEMSTIKKIIIVSHDNYFQEISNIKYVIKNKNLILDDSLT